MSTPSSRVAPRVGDLVTPLDQPTLVFEVMSEESDHRMMRIRQVGTSHNHLAAAHLFRVVKRAPESSSVAEGEKT